MELQKEEKPNREEATMKEKSVARPEEPKNVKIQDILSGLATASFIILAEDPKLEKKGTEAMLRDIDYAYGFIKVVSDSSYAEQLEDVFNASLDRLKKEAEKERKHPVPSKA